jgi:SNF2 family DNA or RNA helicase
MFSRTQEEQYIFDAVSNQLTEMSPQADQPIHICVPMRPHQLTMLAAARNLETKAAVHSLLASEAEPQMLTSYGVIADRVGAGKSLVVLALLKDPDVKQSKFTCTEGGTARIIGINHMPPSQEFGDWDFGEKNYTRTSLLVAPHNVIQQWSDYVQNQTNYSENVVFIRKTKDCNTASLDFFRKIFTADAVIVSCTMLKKFKDAFANAGIRFSNIVWSRVFIDEADTIHCTLRYGEISYRFIWFITGSWLNMLFPNGVSAHYFYRDSAEVKKIMGDGNIRGISTNNIVSQSVSGNFDGRFTALVLRNASDWIDVSVLQPRIHYETILCSSTQKIRILAGFIPSSAMEALHAEDIDGAMTALGIHPTSSETLVERVTQTLEKQLAQAEKILEFKRGLDYSTAAIKEHAIHKAEQNVIRIQTQKESLLERIHKDVLCPCPICYEPPRFQTMTPCCSHAFCLECICNCIKQKPECPMCRSPILTTQDLIVVGNPTKETGQSQSQSQSQSQIPSKSATLIRILTESTPDQRFLVFSAHEASFKGLQDVLAARGIRCEMLSGSTSRIERIRANFRNGTVRVLCMNARHIGAGINLESASHVILYHRMNMEMERQVIGRAVRFERAADLRVIHLVHKDETSFSGSTDGIDVVEHV